MDQSKCSTCLHGTRLDVIKLVLDWFSADDSNGWPGVMWLYGLVGTGKSTLSTTIARIIGRTEGLNLLGAFFFFDRNVPSRNALTLIRTFAFQLAQFDPIIGAEIQRVVADIPDIASQSLAVQFPKLPVMALADIPWSRGPVEESGSVAEQENLMRVLFEGASKLPLFIRLLIVSSVATSVTYHTYSTTPS